MPTTNQVSTLDLSQNLVANVLNSPNKAQAVYDLSGQYNVMDFIFNIMSGGKARQVNVKDGYFEKPIMGRSELTATVAAAPTISGDTLTVVFTDPNFTGFRYKFVIGDGTAGMNQGRLIGKGPGYIVMETTPGTGAWTSAHFAAGSVCSELFEAAGNRGSTGVESRYEVPKYLFNQTGICRESLILYRRDLMDTYVKWAGDNWYQAQQPLMMRNYARKLEKKAYFSQYGTKTNSTLEGNVQYSMGIRQAILDPQRGGIYIPVTGTITQAMFEGWIARIADRKNNGMRKLTIGCGRGFLSVIQSIYSSYIQYAGSENTFGGGAVKGVDFYNLAFNGIEVKLFLIPFLNDRELFPVGSTISGYGNFTRMQYTAIVFDENNYTSVDGEMLPTMEKVYFGPREVEFGYIPGLGGGNIKGANLYTGNLNMAVSDKDATSLEIYSDVCHDTIAYNMGLLEAVV